jgi:apolipoprotein N-acyltransferase
LETIMTTMTLSAPRIGIADRSLWRSAALALAGGGLLAASYALHPLWWAAWLAPVALLPAAAGRPRNLWMTSAIAGVTASLPLVAYYLSLAGPGLVVTVIVLRFAMLAGALLLTRFAAGRLPLGVAMFAFPSTLAALEQVMLATSVNGAAGSIAYSQSDMPGLIQVAALGGVPAVVFLILLPGSLAGLLLSRPWPAAQRVGAIAGAILLGLAVALYSAAHLRRDRGAVQAVMLATDAYPYIPTDWANVWATYAPAVATNAVRGGLVVLPEKIALLDTVAAQAAARDVATAAKATGATLVVGIEVKGDVYRNRALIAFPDGRTAWYDKQRMVPHLEDRDVPGSTPFFASIGGVQFGVAICKDMHIPSIGREYAGRVGLMAVPAWDFGRDGWMGARMTAMRAVESGYAIARASRDGLVGGYDSNGRVIAEQRSADTMAVARIAMPAEARTTLYGRIGDVFGWVCVGLTALLAGGSFIARVRKNAAQKSLQISD